jgi:Mg-chelatase subunit ChlD
MELMYIVLDVRLVCICWVMVAHCSAVMGACVRLRTICCCRCTCSTLDLMPAHTAARYVSIQVIQDGPKPFVRNPIMRSQHLDVTVNEFCSFGTLTMRFRNPFDQPVEMLYSFPLLDGGAVVTGIKSEWDGHIIEGVVRDSATGKREYKEALSKGHTASMVEHAENDLFLWRLGGIPAGADVCVTSRFVGPIDLMKKCGKRALTEFTLTLPTTVPPWHNRAVHGDAALAHTVAGVRGFKVLTLDELSALTVDKLRKRLQSITKSEGNKENGEKLRKEALVNRLFQLQQNGASADSAAADTQAATADEAFLAIPPFSAVVRSKFVTREFQSVIVNSPTHGNPSSHVSSGAELTVQYDDLFATPPGAVKGGPSNLQFRWSIDGVLPNIACLGRVVAGSGRVASVSASSSEVVARDQADTRALSEAAHALSGGPLAAEAAQLAEKAASSERTFEEVVGVLYSEPSDLLTNKVHVTVLVDFSGSMSGIRIQNALKALRAILTSLDDQSTFSVFKFGSSCVGVPIGNNFVIEATPANIQAIMSKIPPSANMGGTHLLDAVQTVLNVGAQTNRRNNIMIITDGEVGDKEAHDVKNLLSASCPASALAGIVGVGNDVTRATLRAVVDGGCGPQALVFDGDSEETIAENIVGAVSALIATDFKTVLWPSNPVLCTGHRIVVNLQNVSASWALYSDGSARTSEVRVVPISVRPVPIPTPRAHRIWTQEELQSLTVDKLRKMLRSQIKTEYPSGGFRRKEDMVQRLLEKQPELEASNAAAALAATEAYAQAVATHSERTRPVHVPYFAVDHAETVKNMCIVAAVTRTRDVSCSSAEANRLALRYGFVGRNSDTVMVAISHCATGDSCKSTVAVGLPGEHHDGQSNLDNAVWGYGSSGSSPGHAFAPNALSYRPRMLPTSGNPIKPVAKCFKPKGIPMKPRPLPMYSFATPKSCSYVKRGIAKAACSKKAAPKKCSAPAKCAAKKSVSTHSFTKCVRASLPDKKVAKPAAPQKSLAKRSRDSVSLLDILGALSGGSWRVSDATVRVFIENHCKTSSTLSSDAAATIAVIVILRSKFSNFKKGWHVHVNRSKAFARKSVGDATYTSLKQNFKASLL